VSAAIEAADNNLSASLEDSLARERALGRTYRQQMQTAWSPRVRRLWEEGWAVKRRHEEVLARILASDGGTPGSEASVPPLSVPSPREVLSWAYDQERLLALRYRDNARHAVDPETRSVFDRLADEQARVTERVRETYRDYSTA
jgi:rubrerythrin